MRTKHPVPAWDFFSERQIEVRYQGLLRGWAAEQKLGSQKYWASSSVRSHVRQIDYYYRKKEEKGNG